MWIIALWTWLLSFVSGFTTGVRGLFGFCLVLLVLATSCVNSKASSQDQTAQADRQLAFIDKGVEIAERHGTAYSATIEGDGRGSIGESLDLFVDTGLQARMHLFGNAAQANMLDVQVKMTDRLLLLLEHMMNLPKKPPQEVTVDIVIPGSTADFDGDGIPDHEDETPTIPNVEEGGVVDDATPTVPV